MKRIFLSSPHMSDQGFEKKYIKEAFDTNWIAPLGKNVDNFEIELAKMVGSKHATAVSSGTDAIHLALKAVGVKAGDVVFCQSLTFAATANPIVYENAKPVFIDSAPGTWNMDPKLLEKAFEKYTPKAVIIVHLYGMTAEINDIKAICDKHHVPLVEDAAESLGTTYQGKWTGTFGDYGIFSFNGNKIITTSGGGMLISDNKTGIAKAKFWATQAREPKRYYQHKEIGYNYRMSNIVAGIGRGQLKVLADRVRQKRHIFTTYKNGLADIDGISFIDERPGERANFWLSPILIDSSKVTPDIVIDALEQENIESRRIWKPMHLQPVYADCDTIGGKVAEVLFNRGVCLPSDTKMTDDDLQRVISIIHQCFE